MPLLKKGDTREKLETPGVAVSSLWEILEDIGEEVGVPPNNPPSPQTSDGQSLNCYLSNSQQQGKGEDPHTNDGQILS